MAHVIREVIKLQNAQNRPESSSSDVQAPVVEPTPANAPSADSGAPSHDSAAVKAASGGWPLAIPVPVCTECWNAQPCGCEQNGWMG